MTDKPGCLPWLDSTSVRLSVFVSLNQTCKIGGDKHFNSVFSRIFFPRAKGGQSIFVGQKKQYETDKSDKCHHLLDERSAYIWSNNLMSKMKLKLLFIFHYHMLLSLCRTRFWWTGCVINSKKKHARDRWSRWYVVPFLKYEMHYVRIRHVGMRGHVPPPSKYFNKNLYTEG